MEGYQMKPLQELIQNQIDRLNDESQTIKGYQAEIREALENDTKLLEYDAEVKDWQAKKKKRKEEILANMRDLVDAISEHKEEKAALESALSGSLLMWFKDNNTLQYQDAEGQLYRIQFKGKVEPTNQPDLFANLEITTVERVDQ